MRSVKNLAQQQAAADVVAGLTRKRKIPSRLDGVDTYALMKLDV